MEQGHKPTVICVEHDGKASAIDRIAARKGYRRVLLNETNIVFAK